MTDPLLELFKLLGFGVFAIAMAVLVFAIILCIIAICCTITTAFKAVLYRKLGIQWWKAFIPAYADYAIGVFHSETMAIFSATINGIAFLSLTAFWYCPASEILLVTILCLPVIFLCNLLVYIRVVKHLGYHGWVAIPVVLIPIIFIPIIAFSRRRPISAGAV